jgi:hypothetical protein
MFNIYNPKNIKGFELKESHLFIYFLMTLALTLILMTNPHQVLLYFISFWLGYNLFCLSNLENPFDEIIDISMSIFIMFAFSIVITIILFLIAALSIFEIIGLFILIPILLVFTYILYRINTIDNEEEI